MNHELHEINTIAFEGIFFLKISIRAFCLPQRNEMETCGKNIYIGEKR